MFVAISILMSSQAATAEAPSAAVKDKCGPEIRSVCSWHFTPDSITRCVEENRAKLSPECQGFWEIASKCQTEMKAVCGWLFPFGIKYCFSNYADQFSKTCRETLEIN
jgi:hypothetical protein